MQANRWMGPDYKKTTYIIAGRIFYNYLQNLFLGGKNSARSTGGVPRPGSGIHFVLQFLSEEVCLLRRRHLFQGLLLPISSGGRTFGDFDYQYHFEWRGSRRSLRRFVGFLQRGTKRCRGKNAVSFRLNSISSWERV